MKTALFFIAGCLLVSCSGKNKIPSDIIGINQMTEIMWDVLRAQALASEISRRDSVLNIIAETRALTQKVLDVHKTTAADYNKSYNWYSKHPDVMQIIFDSLYNQKQRPDTPTHGQHYEHIKKDSFLRKKPEI